MPCLEILETWVNVSFTGKRTSLAQNNQGTAFYSACLRH